MEAFQWELPTVLYSSLLFSVIFFKNYTWTFNSRPEMPHNCSNCILWTMTWVVIFHLYPFQNNQQSEKYAKFCPLTAGLFIFQEPFRLKNLFILKNSKKKTKQNKTNKQNKQTKKKTQNATIFKNVWFCSYYWKLNHETLLPLHTIDTSNIEAHFTRKNLMVKILLLCPFVKLCILTLQYSWTSNG